MTSDEPPEKRGDADGIVTVHRARGFVVEGEFQRFVITAAHCLPALPRPFEERTYPDLLGPLGGPATVCAECVFVDPVADLAVLGPPDPQGLWNHAEAYNALLHSVSPFPVSEPPLEAPAWLYSLDQRWFACRVSMYHPQGPLWILEPSEGIVGGMSGSPIKASDGSAISLMSIASETDSVHGPNPVLVSSLPVWLARTFFIFHPHFRGRLTPEKRLRKTRRSESSCIVSLKTPRRFPQTIWRTPRALGENV